MWSLSLITIAPRSIQAEDGSTCKGPSYELNSETSLLLSSRLALVGKMLRGYALTENPEWSPEGGRSSIALAPIVSACLSIGPCQQCREGGPSDWALQDLHTTRPGLHLESLVQPSSLETEGGQRRNDHKHHLMLDWQ